MKRDLTKLFNELQTELFESIKQKFAAEFKTIDARLARLERAVDPTRPAIVERKNGTTMRLRISPPQTYSIREFCSTHGISVGHFYTIRKLGTGPREMRVGRRYFISMEAAAQWRIACEKETAN
jgi:hypothetical protein